jgi:hypothetical protein
MKPVSSYLLSGDGIGEIISVVIKNACKVTVLLNEMRSVGTSYTMHIF